MLFNIKTDFALEYAFVDVHISIQIDLNKSVIQVTKLRIISRQLTKLSFTNATVKFSLKFFKKRLERKLICMLNDKVLRKFVYVDHYLEFDKMIVDSAASGRVTS